MLNSPSACKNGHPCDISGIKEAISCGAQHDPDRGSQVDVIAAALDIKPGTFRDGTNPNEPDWLSLKHLDTVATFTANHPVIARHFAKLQGGFFYKVNPATVSEQATAKTIVEFGEFLQALPAGKITPQIAARVEKEGAEAMAMIKAVIDAVTLRAAVEGQ